MSITSIRETLLQEVNVLPADYCPAVLDFITSLKVKTADGRRQTAEDDEDDYENWSDEQREAWLASNPPIPIEDDPFFTPEHIERIRQRFKDIDEGKTKVITFTPEQLKEFWEEIEHSPEEAIAKARSRAHYRTPNES